MAVSTNFLLLLGFVWASVLLQCCCVNQDIKTYCYFVIPDNNETSSPDVCPSRSECQRISLANYSSEVFERSFSTFYFLSGTHTLNSLVNVTKRISNLNIIGCSCENSSENCSCNHKLKPAAVVQCEQNNKTGFLFMNVHNLSIVGLSFKHCGFTVNNTIAGALIMKMVWNLYMCGVEINSSNGWGLSCTDVRGTSLINYTSIDYSRSFPGYSGGNMHLAYEHSNHTNASFTIAHSEFSNGFNGYNQTTNYTAYGGGIRIYVYSTDKIHIMLYCVTFIANQAQEGGNLALTYKTVHNSWLSSITIHQCHFLNGIAHIGGGIYISLIADVESENGNSSENSLAVNVTRSKIYSNTADVVGAGLYLQLHESTLITVVADILFETCEFQHNTNLNQTYGRGGTAVNLINFHVPGYVAHQSPQYNISFVSCTFTENWKQSQSDDSVGSGTLYMEENAYTLLRNCSFSDNNSTGITAVHSNFIVQGNLTLRNNRGYNGGGMVLCANSVMYLNLTDEENVLIENCHADNFGGGIYAEFECTQAIPPCFFQVSNSTNIGKRLVHLHYNTATIAGTAIFGGAVDYCYAFGPYERKNKTKVFNDLFDIQPSQHNNLSKISSNPIKVCACNTSGLPDCKINTHVYGSVVYPGSIVSLSVVVVGQRDGTVPGIVVASLKDNNDYNHTLRDLQNTPETQQNCTTLNYRIMSDAIGQNETIFLAVGNTVFKNSLIDASLNTSIIVTIQDCPLGFSLTGLKCGCSEWIIQQEDHTPCNITTESIFRNGNSTWWFGVVHNSTAIYGQYCPLDYCITDNIDLKTTKNGFQDRQCANGRTDILCGACKGNLSNVFGSTACKQCNVSSLLRMLGLIILFAVLGIVLVFVMGILDLTVSEGTLNAIVFYMNVVKVNTSIFFHFKKDTSFVTSWLKVFVAWMNLDLGIETCFYDGMGAEGKTALQFLFPLYLFFLTVLIIYFSRRSSLVTRLVGKNAVQILATIIFHFYAKLLRTIIDIMRRSEVTSQHETTQVWTIDGSIPYLHGQHTFLFALAVCVAAITLPYTLALLFIQCLRKKSNMKVLCWVNRFKPFFDAYTGPYKDKYHFWTGFLLVVRIALFIVIATNESKGPTLNLTLIIATTSLLLLLTQSGIYKSWALNIVEAFSYTNLIVLTAGTAYDRVLCYGNDVPIIVCIGSMFLLFCGVVFYHVYKRLSGTRRFRIMKVWLLDKRWPWMKRKPIRSLVLPYIDPDNIDELSSSSDSELDPILQNAPPVARYDEYREPLVESENND